MKDLRGFIPSCEADPRLEGVSTSIHVLYLRPKTSTSVAEKNLVASSKVTTTSGSSQCRSMDRVRSQTTHFGFKWSNFTEQQRRRLQIEPTDKSYYTAREDIYFPFLTSEVKCGKQGLDLADRPNSHSTTIALRGIVDLYREANRASEVHGRALAFSISPDDNRVRIYVHHPEINGDETTFWRETLKEFNFGNEQGKEKWVCYQFTPNVCQIFALSLVERLKAVIDQLPDPIMQSLEPAASYDEASVLGSQDDASALEIRDEGFRKPRKAGGLNAELPNMIQSLQRQLEQQKE